jgi:cytochrome c-type biogenesis protein CcmH
MHRDVMSLVSNGYSADEILAAFSGAYGERVLMAPVKQGFNWLGYLLPFAALGGAAAAAATVIRRWGREAPAPGASPTQTNATAEELARLEAAIRDDR